MLTPLPERVIAPREPPSLALSVHQSTPIQISCSEHVHDMLMNEILNDMEWRCDLIEEVLSDLSWGVEPHPQGLECMKKGYFFATFCPHLWQF